MRKHIRNVALKMFKICISKISKVFQQEVRSNIKTKTKTSYSAKEEILSLTLYASHSNGTALVFPESDCEMCCELYEKCILILQLLHFGVVL